MASPGPSASAADDGDRLKKAHDELRIVDAETRSLLRELDCLMTVKTLLFPAEHNGPGQAGSTYWRAWYQRKGFGDQPPLESEWWKRAGGRGLLNSAENLRREIEHVEIQGAALVAHRDAVWRAVNALSRPFLRSLSIMNLPEETLLGILELVEGFDPDLPVSYGMSGGRRDIQNVRLVCRCFCELGSQLLVRRVRISPNEASLARLRAVSRHPTISRGVRAFRVGLHFETSALGDLGTFFSHLHTEAQDETDSHDQLWDITQIPEETETQISVDVAAVLSKIRGHASADTESDDDVPALDDENCRASLDQAHRKYRALLKNQASLIDTGEFVRLFGSAAARLTSVWKLDVADHNPVTERHRMISGAGMRTLICRSMLQVAADTDAEQYRLGLSNFECTIQLIRAVGKTGTVLDSLDINLQTLGSPGGMAAAPDAWRELSSATRRLTAFSVKAGMSADAPEAGGLHDFLSACLETASLQKLKLDMGSPRPPGESVDLGKVLCARPRPHLMDMTLSCVAVNLSDLKQLPQPMKSIHLTQVHLLTGTWKAALDVFREKTSGQFSECEFWILGQGTDSRNPLQVLEDDEDDDDEDGEDDEDDEDENDD